MSSVLIRTRKAAIILVLLAVAAASSSQIFSGYQRTRMMRDAQIMFDAHVQSVARIVREGTEEAATSTALIYELAEEQLIMGAALNSIDNKAAAKYFEVPVPAVHNIVTSDNTFAEDEILIPPEKRTEFISWMKNQPALRLVDDGPLGELGLICIRFIRASDWGVHCDTSELLDEQRREVGIGPQLNAMIQNDIRYAVIQDSDGIIAAAPSHVRVSSFSSDATLSNVRQSNHPDFRIVKSGIDVIYEGLIPFTLMDGSNVILRVGMDAAPMIRLQKNADERWMTVTFLTLAGVILVIVFAVLWVRSQQKKIQMEETMVEAEEQQRHWKLIGGLAASVAHEVRNPLSTIRMISTRLNRELPLPAENGDIKEMLTLLRTESDRVESVVQGFLALGKPHRVRYLAQNVSEVLHRIIAGPLMKAEAASTHVSITLAEDLVFPLDEELLDRIIGNLLHNALDAAGGEGQVSLAIHTKRDELTIEIRDSGPGMDSDALHRATEPFITTKSTGTGLGLPIVVRGVEMLGGQFALHSEKGKGTTAIVVLPSPERKK